MSWFAFDNGKSIGQRGSEGGTIIRDEEHGEGARITLERDGQTAPVAITCGIYGWMLHTRFFDTEDEAAPEYERMKQSLDALLEAAEKTAETDGGRQVLMDGVTEFVEQYP